MVGTPSLISCNTARLYRFCNGFGIVVIPRRFRKQEDMFIGFGRSVLYIFGQTVCLVPDNIRTQIPSVRAECKGKHPRDSNHILCLDSVPHNRHSVNRRRRIGTVIVFAVRFLRCPFPYTLSASGIAVGNVQPKRPVVREYPPDLPKHLYQTADIRLRRFLRPDLPVHAVIPKPIIRRACYT